MTGQVIRFARRVQPLRDEDTAKRDEALRRFHAEVERARLWRKWVTVAAMVLSGTVLAAVIAR